MSSACSSKESGTLAGRPVSRLSGWFDSAFRRSELAFDVADFFEVIIQPMAND